MATLTEACGEDPGLVCESVYDWTGSERVAELADWLVTVPLRILIIVLGAVVLNRVARRAITGSVERVVRERLGAPDLRGVPVIGGIGAKAAEQFERLSERSERSRQRADTLGALLRSMATAAIAIVATLLVLGELSINLGPLIAGAGIAGIAIGFGAQSVVRDFVAGMFIVLEDQYGVGDVVDVGDVTATVEQISWRTTWLRDVEGALWIVPNGAIRRVSNKSQLWSRAVLDVAVGYDVDLERAMAVLKATADEVWQAELAEARIIEEPEVWGVEAFTDTGVTVRLVMKTEPGAQWRVAREIRTRLKPAFERAGIAGPARVDMPAPEERPPPPGPPPVDGGPLPPVG